MREREGCCSNWSKPCPYHEGWQDAMDAALGFCWYNTERDQTFIEWVACRLVLKGDSPDEDFIGKLCAIARVIPETQRTSNTGLDSRQYALLHGVKPYG